MRKWGQSQSFLEWAKFYAEWNNYSCAARNSVFSLTTRYIFQLTKCEHKGASESIDCDEINFSSVKPQQIFNFFKLEYFISGVL